MLGALIGDIIGSVYESRYRNIKTKDFPLFSRHGKCTDDSTLTIATADWLLHGGNIGEYYLKYAIKYPYAGYGGKFRQWVSESSQQGIPAPPYYSCGNGSAMRVGPIGWAFSTKEATLEAARQSAECTHNHPEGIKGAQAVALCIFMARTGASKALIRQTIESEFGYDLRFTCDSIRSTYSWKATCQGSVPQAIVAFLDGTDFEDCIRNAISIGGDSDTIGCITGSIAEAFYGIPQGIREKALGHVPAEFRNIVSDFELKYGPYTNGRHNIRIYKNEVRPLYTPEKLSTLKSDEVFVFGSNLQGMHAGGAAKAAYAKFGAIWGQGVGLQGQSYAIPTMHGGAETIRPYIDEFIIFARAHNELFFYVTRIGCGIAGFKDWEIAPMFADATSLPNVCLPKTFADIIQNMHI